MFGLSILSCKTLANGLNTCPPYNSENASVPLDAAHAASASWIAVL
jgi:hypothetical protein